MEAAERAGGRVRLRTRNREGAAGLIVTDHVIAATGFRATTDRLDVLTPGLRQRLLSLQDGTPYVSDRFETSCPGLFTAGLTTASSFGPAMRFVYGASYTASALVRGVRRHVRRRPDVVLPPQGRAAVPSRAGASAR